MKVDIRLRGNLPDLLHRLQHASFIIRHHDRDQLGRRPQRPSHVVRIHASAPIDLTGRKTAKLISGATLTVYPGAGHGLYASDHDTDNVDLLTFINGHAHAVPPHNTVSQG